MECKILNVFQIAFCTQLSTPPSYILATMACCMEHPALTNEAIAIE